MLFIHRRAATFGAALACLASTSIALAQGYHVVSAFGGYGANGQYYAPNRVGVAGSGNVYASYQAGNYVEKFDNSGNYLSLFGAAGSGNGQFNTLYGITSDASGNVYVADSGNNRVQKFNGDGVYLSQFGSSGVGAGQFDKPCVFDAGQRRKPLRRRRP